MCTNDRYLYLFNCRACDNAARVLHLHLQMGRMPGVVFRAPCFGTSAGHPYTVHEKRYLKNDFQYPKHDKI